MMKAVRFHEYGGPGVLTYEDIAQPAPGPRQVRIRVAATSFNPVDASIRSGNLGGPFPIVLPHTPGIDVAGTVDALGEGVTNVRLGDEVIAFLPMVADGAAAEYVIAPADTLATAPSTIDLRDAAALPLVGLTAQQALFEHGQLKAGQRILINGAGGAVGGYAVQLAKLANAYVIAAASPRSSERARMAGADEVLEHSTTDVIAAVTEPVDVLLNLAPIAPDTFEAMVGIVRAGGIVVNTTVWMQAPADEARNVRAINVFVRSDAEKLSELAALVNRGDLRVDVADRVPLAELSALHAKADKGAVSGKVIVFPAS